MKEQNLLILPFSVRCIESIVLWESRGHFLGNFRFKCDCWKVVHSKANCFLLCFWKNL